VEKRRGDIVGGWRCKRVERGGEENTSTQHLKLRIPLQHINIDIKDINMALDLSDDEEIGEFIYRTSNTAKLLREKQEKDDDDMRKSTDRSIENHLLPINMREEAVKVEVKTEDDVSTDDKCSPEYVISSSSGYDQAKKEETDDEELGEDTNTSNEQHLPIKAKAEVKTEDVSTDDECGGEKKKAGRPRTSTRSLANSTTQPNCKRNREVVESNGSSSQKATRIECSVEGCNGKAADNGRCKTNHGGRNYCSQGGCTNLEVKGGVCRRHLEFAIVKEKGPHMTCSVEGCNYKAADSGMCKAKHNGYNHCSRDGCTKAAKKGGVCMRHGAKMKSCKHEGCTNQVQSRGVCVRHGAKRVKKTCNHEGCTNYVQKGGVCIKHGAKRKTCRHDGCTKQSQKGGVCIKHGAKVKTCSQEGCTNNARGKEGFCYKHGAKKS